MGSVFAGMFSISSISDTQIKQTHVLLPPPTRNSHQHFSRLSLLYLLLVSCGHSFSVFLSTIFIHYRLLEQQCTRSQVGHLILTLVSENFCSDVSSVEKEEWRKMSPPTSPQACDLQGLVVP